MRRTRPSETIHSREAAAASRIPRALTSAPTHPRAPYAGGQATPARTDLPHREGRRTAGKPACGDLAPLAAPCACEPCQTVARRSVWCRQPLAMPVCRPRADIRMRDRMTARHGTCRNSDGLPNHPASQQILLKQRESAGRACHAHGQAGAQATRIQTTAQHHVPISQKVIMGTRLTQGIH